MEVFVVETNFHMFDDCLYPPKSVYNRVATVVEHDSRCLGCLAYATFDTKLMVSMGENSLNYLKKNATSEIISQQYANLLCKYVES